MRQARRREVVAGLSALAASAPRTALAAPPKVGHAAPDFQATLYDGRKVSLADFRDRVLILNLWATWCGPCKAELPLLNGYAKLMEPHGLAVLAVASPDSAEPRYLKPLAAALAIPLVSRMRGPYDDLGGYPTNYVVDRAGTLRYAQAGAFSLDALNALLVPLLNARPAPSPATA